MHLLRVFPWQICFLNNLPFLAPFWPMCVYFVVAELHCKPESYAFVTPNLYCSDLSSYGCDDNVYYLFIFWYWGLRVLYHQATSPSPPSLRQGLIKLQRLALNLEFSCPSLPSSLDYRRAPPHLESVFILITERNNHFNKWILFFKSGLPYSWKGNWNGNNRNSRNLDVIREAYLHMTLLLLEKMLQSWSDRTSVCIDSSLPRKSLNNNVV